MSYILDALRKSDKERSAGKTPHLHIVHGYPSPDIHSPRPYRAMFLWIFSVVLVAGCATTAFFLFYTALANKQTVHVVEQEKTTAAQTPQLMDSAPQHATPVAPIVLMREKIKLRLPVENETDPLDTQPLAVAPPADNNLPLLLKDLPEDIQDRLPDLKFAGHTFAQNPSQRMIIVNDKILKEGGKIDPFTRLVEITWEGVILESDGVVYRVITH